MLLCWCHKEGDYVIALEVGAFDPSLSSFLVSMACHDQLVA
jgi:hypothetical protein